MALRPATLVGLLTLGVLLAAPSVPAAIDPDDLPAGVGDQLGNAGANQGGDVQQAAEELRKRLEGSTGDAGPVVPRPPGTERGVDDIPDGVTNVLFEDPAVTAGVAVGLIAAAASGWWLASRYIDPKVALQSPERSMLYGFIKGNPGVHLKQLSTEFRMKTSTVLWHVRKLEHADLIRSKKANGYRVFYPVSGGLEASKVSEAVTALSNANARGVFAFLAEHPTAPLRNVTERLGINPGTVRWHLKKLRKAGLLEEYPGGAGLRVSDLGVKAWNQLQGNPATVQVTGVSVPPSTEAPAEEITA